MRYSMLIVAFVAATDAFAIPVAVSAPTASLLERGNAVSGVKKVAAIPGVKTAAGIAAVGAATYGAGGINNVAGGPAAVGGGLYAAGGIAGLYGAGKGVKAALKPAASGPILPLHNTPAAPLRGLSPAELAAKHKKVPARKPVPGHKIREIEFSA